MKQAKQLLILAICCLTSFAASAQLATITEVNLTLEDDCTAVLLPSQVITGVPDADDDDDDSDPFADFIVIVRDGSDVEDDAIQGCGRFIYEVTGPDGFSGWGYVNAEDKTPADAIDVPGPFELLCTDRDINTITTLPASVDRCYRVNAADGSIITGSFDLALANRLRVVPAGTAPLTSAAQIPANVVVPTFVDGCAEELEVCVQDNITFTGDPQCDDVILTRTFTATELGKCFKNRPAGESNQSTTASYTITFVRPSLDDLGDNPIDSLLTIEGCGNTGTPPAVALALNFGDRVINLTGEGTVCNIGVTFEDQELGTTCPNTRKILRTYTVYDWCPPVRFRQFTQFIKIGDFTPPTITAPVQDLDFNGIPDTGALFFPTNAGNICAAYIRLDDPSIEVDDNCDGPVVGTAIIFPGGDTTAAGIGAFQLNFDDNNAEITTQPIPVGSHLLRYTVTDVCGNTTTLDVDFVVADRTAPVAICEDGLNISITAGQSATAPDETGIAVLRPEQVDNGSYDDCGPVHLKIARVGADNEPLPGEEYRHELELYCSDVDGDGMVAIGLEVTDELGNVNTCWLDVLVEDKARPACIVPGPQRISCIEYNATLPAIITEATDEELDAAFGAAFGIDNCESTVTQEIVGSLNSCGVGSFTRTFTVTDGQGFTNAQPCVQQITVFGVHDYTITFPADVEGDCEDVPDYPGVSSVERACDLIAVDIEVDTFRSQLAPFQCFKLEVNYEIINWCEYDGEGQPYLIARDGNIGRDVEDELLYLHVVPGADQDDLGDDFAFLSESSSTVFSAGDALLDDGDDDDDDDMNGDDVNDEDDYADDNSRGFFRYIQFVKIYDDEAPVIDAEELDECFAGSGENCTADLSIDFELSDNCTPYTTDNADDFVSVELDADYNVALGFQQTAFVSAVANGDGTYTVNLTDIPVGEHALRVRASDGCGNFDVEIIEFCVVGDKAPTPICIRELVVPLMPSDDPTTGGGMAAIWASDFIQSRVEDCFGNEVTKFAIYTEDEVEVDGVSPDFPRTGIELDCDDLDTDVFVRIYAYDDAEETSDYCTAIVTVQDNNGVCDGGSTGTLAGTIATQDDAVMAAVDVNLTGAGNMDLMAQTDAAGVYTFTGLPLGADYTIEPAYEPGVDLRTVKTSDIIAVTRHILGTSVLASSYEMVAADVNGDEEIDIFDAIGIRRVILDLDQQFAAGASWAFVAADYTFPASGYVNTFPRVFNANNLVSNELSADFVAIELGNVDRSGESRASLDIEVANGSLAAGQVATVELNAAGLAGFQGTLELAAGLELVGVDYDAAAGAMNLNAAAEGLIAMSFSAPVVVTVEVRATVAGELSELLSLSDAVTVREGVSTTGESAGLALNFTAATAAAGMNSLAQNVPNPVTETTRISYTLAEAGQVTLQVRDVQGRTVLVRELSGAAGTNVIELSVNELSNATGVLSYTVSNSNFSATKQMVVVR